MNNRRNIFFLGMPSWSHAVLHESFSSFNGRITGASVKIWPLPAMKPFFSSTRSQYATNDGTVLGAYRNSNVLCARVCVHYSAAQIIWKNRARFISTFSPSKFESRNNGTDKKTLKVGEMTNWNRSLSPFAGFLTVLTFLFFFISHADE